MKIETLQVAGQFPALYAMRNPMTSNARADSEFTGNGFVVGDADKALSIKLQKAGPEHCKHLRMVMVWADITASLTWWKQADCYRAGVEKVSTSTMHKLMSRPLSIDDFEAANIDCYSQQLCETVEYLNRLINAYNTSDDPAEKKQIWEYAIQILPQSYLQRRTVMFSYAALRNIVRQRKGHKLSQWSSFIDWAKSLPESWMIFDEEVSQFE